MAHKPFHNPFGDLKRKLAERERPPTSTATPTPTPTSTSTSTSTDRPTRSSDQDLWAQATAGVRRIDPGPGRAAPRPPPPAPREFWHPDLEALDALQALVRGDGPFDVSDGDEFIEGRAPGVDAGIARKLRRGEYAVQGHLDLHGMTREEAKAAVLAFLRGARGGGKRCVLLVHGRGTHSRDQVPVLKEALRSWLATARFARDVLAFATARPEDGGGGALYVLLRRAGR